MKVNVKRYIIIIFKTILAFDLIILPVILPGYTQYRRTNPPNYFFLEKEIVKELNLARQNPKKYAFFLEQLKTYYVGRYIKQPGRITIVTEEGISAVDEAIRFLKSMKRVNRLEYSTGMSKAAMDHVKDQGPKGMFGHKGSDGSKPAERMSRYGDWRWTAGENISYGRDKARDIVMGLIIDDGVPGRGHRDNIFNSMYRFVGVACGYHKIFDTMCVITFAGEFVEKRGKSRQNSKSK